MATGTAKLELMAANNLSESARQSDYVLGPKQLRTNAITARGSRVIVEGHCGIVRWRQKLACKTCPARTELGEVNALTVGELVLENTQIRKPQIQNRRGIDGVSVPEDRRMCVDTRVALAGCVSSPGIIGVTICLPIRVAPKQSVLFGKMMVHTGVVLSVDSAGRHIRNEVIRYTRPVRRGVRFRKKS